VSRGAQLYVYYRVRSADAGAVIAAARALQRDLQVAWPGLSCTLSQRADDAADLLTLMETYAHADGVSDEFRRAVEQGAQQRLGQWIAGTRHVELFVPCA
jgi:uncharacterized protein DUF4936